MKRPAISRGPCRLWGRSSQSVKSVLGPLVVEPLGLAQRAFQRRRRDHLYLGADPDRVLDMGRNPVGMIDQTLSVPALWPRLGDDGQLVHAALARQLHDEMSTAPVGRKQHFLDLGREQ